MGWGWGIAVEFNRGQKKAQLLFGSSVFAVSIEQGLHVIQAPKS